MGSKTQAELGFSKIKTGILLFIEKKLIVQAHQIVLILLLHVF